MTKTVDGRTRIRMAETTKPKNEVQKLTKEWKLAKMLTPEDETIRWARIIKRAEIEQGQWEIRKHVLKETGESSVIIIGEKSIPYTTEQYKSETLVDYEELIKIVNKIENLGIVKLTIE